MFTEIYMSNVHKSVFYAVLRAEQYKINHNKAEKKGEVT